MTGEIKVNNGSKNLNKTTIINFTVISLYYKSISILLFHIQYSFANVPATDEVSHDYMTPSKILSFLRFTPVCFKQRLLRGWVWMVFRE